MKRHALADDRSMGTAPPTQKYEGEAGHMACVPAIPTPKERWEVQSGGYLETVGL